MRCLPSVSSVGHRAAWEAPAPGMRGPEPPPSGHGGMKCAPRAGWALVGFGAAISLFLAILVLALANASSGSVGSQDQSEHNAVMAAARPFRGCVGPCLAVKDHKTDRPSPQ